ncbi:portal protein [Dickeya phage Amaethon]|nr:portal protein [Dickeya phage Amaethon]
MHATIEDLRDTFKIGYEAYEDSRIESTEVWNLFHNRHFTREQLAILANRGQPAETFNVIKLYSRMIIGYYSTVVNTAVVRPRWPRDATTAALLNDIINYTISDNKIDATEGDKIKLSGLISGIMVSFCDVLPTKDKDPFGRTINRIEISHVPDYEVVLDPLSRMDDYSDARFLHRFKWMPKETVIKLFGKDNLAKLEEYYNFTEAREADFDYVFKDRFVGKYRVFDNYLIIHSVVEDEDGERWSCFWSNETLLSKEKITYKEVRWPYRLQKVQTSDKCEYYGIFREIVQSQHALNQAVLKLQQLVNSRRVFIEDGAVQNIAEFETAYNRVTGVIPVTKLSGVRPENLSADAQGQYIIIDRALERIQKVLGVNDSFLGMAYASDSGRKVKLQQNATIMSLRYLTARIENYYELMAYDIARLAQQYYKAYQILSITDELTGNKFIAMNEPIMEYTGQVDMQGQQIMQPVLLPEVNPANGEFMEDDAGNIMLGPVGTEDTSFEFTRFQISIDASAYNDDDERSQLLVETVMSGAVGQMMMQANPAGFFKMASLSIRNMKSRYSPDIAEVLDQTAQMLGGNPQANQQLAMANQGSQSGFSNQPGSETMSIPDQRQSGEY